MAIGRTNVGGGGKSFAAVSVTYPAGSICTCTNGAKTLKAKDTSGSFLFLLSEGGTWTVSCTNGEKATSKAVMIEAQYQVKNIVLAYTLYLVQNGVGMVEIYKYGVSVTSGSGVMKIAQSGASSTPAKNADFGPVDLSSFNTLHVNISDMRINNDYRQYSGIGVSQALNTDVSRTLPSLVIPNGSSGVFSLDLGGVSGSYYPFISFDYTGLGAFYSITDFWLE